MAGPEGAARRRAVRGQPGTAGARRPDQSYAISPPLTPPGEGAAEGLREAKPTRADRLSYGADVRKVGEDKIVVQSSTSQAQLMTKDETRGGIRRP
jgi:hypothetical protein